MGEAGKLELEISFQHFIICFHAAGGKIKAKVHGMAHMLARSAELGNPKTYTTYRLESVNGTLSRIAKSCHKAHWHVLIHRKYFTLLTLGLTAGMS